MKKIKAVIFDLDGTLANTLPLCIRAFRKSIEPLINRSVSDAEIVATFGPSEEGTIMALAPDHYKKGVTDYLSFYESLHHMCPTPFDGINDLLLELQNKGVHLAMVTGKGKHSTDISLNYFKLTNFFEIIETGWQHGPRKPEGIQSVVDFLKDINKDEMIYVGDSPGDIIACRKIGIPVIAAAWAETAEPHELEKLNPDQIFYNVSDFKEWLMKQI